MDIKNCFYQLQLSDKCSKLFGFQSDLSDKLWLVLKRMAQGHSESGRLLLLAISPLLSALNLIPLNVAWEQVKPLILKLHKSEQIDVDSKLAISYLMNYIISSRHGGSGSAIS